MNKNLKMALYKYYKNVIKNLERDGGVEEYQAVRYCGQFYGHKDMSDLVEYLKQCDKDMVVYLQQYYRALYFKRYYGYKHIENLARLVNVIIQFEG